MSFREEQYYASSKESFIKLEKDFKSHEGVDFNEYSSEEDLKKLWHDTLENGMHGLCFSMYEDGQKPGDIITEAHDNVNENSNALPVLHEELTKFIYNYLDEINPYEELYDAKYIIERSSGNNKILVQLVNPFNKINFLVTKRGLIIPVKETGILDKTPSVLFNDFVLKDKVINIEKMIDLLNDFNKQDISPKMKFLGITVDSNDMSTGVLTNFGQTLPTKKIPVNKQINIPVLKTKYYSDVDLFLSGKDKKLSSEVKYNQETNDVKDKMFMLKKSIGKNIVGDENAKQTIININKDPHVSKRDKIKRIKNILLDFVDKDLDLGLDKDYLLDNLSNEITNDNIENTIINNLIVSENFNSEEIVKRSTESVWLNIGDIKKWFKKIKM